MLDITSGSVYHALGLHMHQPPGNLKRLIDSNEFEARQIILCYERAQRRAREWENSGRFHVSFSGVLLEQLRDRDIISWCRQRSIDIEAILDGYGSANNIELVGMGYYHPIFPLIPKEDWEDQLILGQQIMQETFGRTPRGFWPPEMSFCMEMVPALVKAGYEYVVVDGDYIQPEDRSYDIYRPYKTNYNGATIVAVPLERSISYAQESGMNEKWFELQASQKVRQSPHPNEPRLVTTWSPGEGGGWFLQLHEESGFFGHFLQPYLEAVENGKIRIQPVLISEYIRDYPPTQETRVRTGPWNLVTDSSRDFSQPDFSQWVGSSEAQRVALKKIYDVSRCHWVLKKRLGILPDEVCSALDEARTWILEAEASCFMVRGDRRIPEIDERTKRAEELLAKAAAASGWSA